MSSRLHILASLVVLQGLFGCTPIALSPPARTLPLESSATLEEGRVAVQAGAGGSPFSSVVTGALRARIAWTDVLEVQAEGSYAHVRYDDPRSPHIGMGRLGVKLAPVPHLAFVAGMGAGGHAHGAYLAPDVGVIAAYENRVLVPWFSARLSYSAPINPTTITVVTTTFGGMPERHALVPDPTLCWQLTTGLRVPIRIESGALERVDVLAGLGVTGIEGLESSNHFRMFHFELALEFVLDARGPQPERLLFVEGE